MFRYHCSSLDKPIIQSRPLGCRNYRLQPEAAKETMLAKAGIRRASDS